MPTVKTRGGKDRKKRRKKDVVRTKGTDLTEDPRMTKFRGLGSCASFWESRTRVRSFFLFILRDGPMLSLYMYFYLIPIPLNSPSLGLYGSPGCRGCNTQYLSRQARQTARYNTRRVRNKQNKETSRTLETFRILLEFYCGMKKTKVRLLLWLSIFFLFFSESKTFVYATEHCSQAEC